MTTTPHTFQALCPKGLEVPLREELTALGLDATETRGAVVFQGTLRDGYQALLWSRIASRVVLSLSDADVESPEELYEWIWALPWGEHIRPLGSFAVSVTGVGTLEGGSRLTTLRVKDAIVDKLRTSSGERPNIETTSPDVRVHIYQAGTTYRAGIDLSRGSMHRRGYRDTGHEAPLKENLAAAILWWAGWRSETERRAWLVDPMCGSGTLVIEAACIALAMAPGLLRDPDGPSRWLGHDAPLWTTLCEEANERGRKAQALAPAILWGSDTDPQAIELSGRHARAAGVQHAVRFEKRDVADARPPNAELGVVVTNPPYGERLTATDKELKQLYSTMGDTFRRHFLGAEVVVLAEHEVLIDELGLRTKHRHVCFNGPIECRALVYSISTEAPRSEGAPKWRTAYLEAAKEFEGRLEKNARHMRKWAEREGVRCYRVYDSDLPQYAVAIDRYEDHLHIQEYAAPKTVDPKVAEARLRAVVELAPKILGVEISHSHLKVRRKQHHREQDQYQRQDPAASEFVATEGGLKVLVNLSGYLDTGLFLDHRVVRSWIREHSKDRDVLNLFSYTGTATLYAAAGGARTTTSVDLSRTYLEWAERNFALNGLSPQHHYLEHADVRVWLEEETNLYGLIFVAPPTFSTSKRMEGTLDVVRDHADLLHAAGRRLTPDGEILFSVHARGFKMAPELSDTFEITDVTEKAVPYDFRRQKPHKTFWLRLKKTLDAKEDL